MSDLSYRSKVDTTESIAATIAAYEHNRKLLDTNNVTTSEYEYPKGGTIVLTPADTTTDKEEDLLRLWPVRDIASNSMGLKAKWMNKNTPSVEITAAHRITANKVRETIGSSIIMNKLRGEKISNFTLKLAQLIGTSSLSFADFGLLAYAAKSANGIKQASKVQEEQAKYMVSSKSLGNDGTKITATITIMSRRYLSLYDSYVHNAHDDNGNLVKFFKNDDSMNIGKTYKVSAKIKQSGPDSYAFNAIVTQINYVRIKK